MPLRAHAESDQTLVEFGMLADTAFDAQLGAARRLPHVDKTKHSLGQRIAIGTARAGGGLIGGVSNAVLGAAILGVGGVADSFQPSYGETKSTDVEVTINGEKHTGTAKIRQRRSGGLLMTAFAATAGAGLAATGYTPDHWSPMLQPVLHMMTNQSSNVALWGAAAGAASWIAYKAAFGASVGAAFGGFNGAKAGAIAAGRKVGQTFSRGR